MSDDKKIIFSMHRVSKTYPPSKQVLKNISLSFFYGAKLGIIGLNGSGKSSLLKIIAGVDQSYNGDVSFSKGYSVGYLEQEPQLDLQLEPELEQVQVPQLERVQVLLQQVQEQVRLQQVLVPERAVAAVACLV